MSQELSSETGMPVAGLLGLVEELNSLQVLFHWKCLPNSEDTLEPACAHLRSCATDAASPS